MEYSQSPIRIQCIYKPGLTVFSMVEGSIVAGPNRSMIFRANDNSHSHTIQYDDIDHMSFKLSDMIVSTHQGRYRYILNINALSDARSSLVGQLTHGVALSINSTIAAGTSVRNLFSAINILRENMNIYTTVSEKLIPYFSQQHIRVRSTSNTYVAITTILYSILGIAMLIGALVYIYYDR